MSIRFECFGMTILKARAIDLEMHDFEGHSVEELTPVGRGGVLILYLPNDGTISLFMSYETALAYASAINTVNDRKAEEAYIPNENTVHIPIAEWRKLNMGVPDAGKDTDTNG